MRFWPSRVTHCSTHCTSLSLSRFSSFLRPENAIFPRRETRGSREHTFVWVHFLHYGGLKMRFLRSNETHGAIFGGSKNPRFMGTWHPRAHFLHFWSLIVSILASCEYFDGLKFLSMPIRENHGSRVPRTVWAHFRFFGGLKTPFLPSCVTHGSRDRSLIWAHFRYLGTSKCYFCQVVDHTIQTYLAFCEIIGCRAAKPTVQV